MKAALFGHPVGHSRSAVLFGALAAAGGPQVEYEAVDVGTMDLPKILERMREGAWEGANVTVPHKVVIPPLLDLLDPSARKAGCVNVISRLPNGALEGANTDGEGFRRGFIQSLGSPLWEYCAAGPAVILGSGGGARAVASELSGEVTVVGRDPARLRLFPSRPGLRLITWDDKALISLVRTARLIVQATPIGMYPNIDAGPELPENALFPDQVAVDLIYNPWETVFLCRARAQGAMGLNGWPMLVHQAALSLEIWLGAGAGDRLPALAQDLEPRDPCTGAIE